MAALALGLSVYNRYRLLALTAASLRSLPGDQCRLVVVNDGSTEFSESDLRDLLPGAIIHTNSRNSGRADFAIVQLANLLLQQEARYVALLDSDLLLHSTFVETVVAAMPHTDGLLTTLNSDRHAVCPTEPIPVADLDNRLVQKQRIGSAGAVWTKDLLAEIVQAVPASPTWDWDYSAYLQGKGKRIFSLERSVVQHLGFWLGQNSSRMSGDWGLGYPSLSPEESSVVAEMLFLGTKSAFAQSAEDNLTTYVSAHRFRPLGHLRGRARTFLMREPLVLAADVFLDAGYHYLFVDAAVTRSIGYLFSRGRNTLELAVHADGKTIGFATTSIARLVGGNADDGLRVEFDNDSPRRARIELRYRGAPAHCELNLRGVFVDRI